MPYYDYYCGHCSTTIPVSHPITSDPVILCEQCKQPRTRKPAVGAVTFKGTGWGSSKF